MSIPTMNWTEWYNSIQAARALGVGTPALKRNAALWGIRVRNLPGRRGLLFNRPDVDAMVARVEAEESARVAAAQAAAAGQSPVRKGARRKNAKEKETARTR